MQPTGNPLSERLRELRQAAGLSQEALAAKVRKRHPKSKMCRTTVAFIEGGRYLSTRTSTLMALAEALGVPMADFFATGESRQPQAAKTAKRAASGGGR